MLAYTYDEIRAYDAYAREFHKGRHDTEMVDHGILSGALIFDRLAKGIRKDAPNDAVKRLRFTKTACLTIAQHNIFKSPNIETDKKYGDTLQKLHSTSDFRISLDTPLLLLLSLVDTFECIKRFGQSENERQYLQKHTILQSIVLDVLPDSLSIDYATLSGRIQAKDERLRECFTRYKNGLCGIDYWTALCAERVSEERIVIRLKV